MTRGMIEPASDRIARLRDERERLRARLADHDRACLASPPHGYLSCQFTREAIESRLDDIEAKLRACERRDGVQFLPL